MNLYVPKTPSKKDAEYGFLKLWVHNEIAKLRHHINSGFATVKRGQQINSENGFKCLVPETGQVYFLFPPSTVIQQGDFVSWGPEYNKDEWVVTSTNQMRECIRCEVRRVIKSDVSIDALLRQISSEAAQYMSNAQERLDSGTSTGYADCVSNCRNALQSTLRVITGEGQLSAGIRKLKEVCEFGDREIEYVQALERVLVSSRDFLSKTGAHPPMPTREEAVFAFEQTTATLRFILTTRAGR